ncbi:SPOC like C-terminal domain-containing protein [Cokeromyces recurvatus]|uniref:SPOC like C-terminal domain-containing protein n=1 Tax=Cokeromyces recurvatus TaxID=90255 RepID=UPI00221F14BD|nr:SPOC like C-terminal domain-containing protein [Cokeromyces recurvatus]KAI7905002.1 SPOC like C-terminal domain-containing protein [Cokeromyces recurvatus]
MAQKKATCYILNVHHLMSNDFTKALSTLTDNIEDKILSGRKTDMVSVLLSGTPETHNILAEQTPGQYQNITSLCSIAQPNVDLLRKLQNISTSKETIPSADVLDAVIIATQMIVNHCKKLKYNKAITVFTNATYPIDWLDLDAVVDMLQSNDIRLTIVGTDYDLYKSADCPEIIRCNYDNWMEMTKRIGNDSEVLSLSEAYGLTQMDYAKEIRSVPSYRGYLYLGNPRTNEHFLAIHIFMYLRTKETKLPIGSKWSALSNGPTHEVIAESKYVIDEDTAASYQGENFIGDQTEIEISKDELEKAFRFGKTIVKISDEEMEVAQLRTNKEMTILGFIPADTFPRHYLYSNAHIITAGNYCTEESALALRSFAYALYEKGCLALVRYVFKDDGQPKIGVLHPELVLGSEGIPDTLLLQYFNIPFAEDIRDYKFRSFKNPRVNDPKGIELMNNLVDSMNLDQIGKEYLVPELNFNPILWRFNKTIKMRALNPSANIPDIKESAKCQFEISPYFKEKASELGEKIANYYNVQKVEDNTEKKKRTFKEMENNDIMTESYNIDIDEIIRSVQQSNSNNNTSIEKNLPNIPETEVESVGMITPVEDFRALLNKPSEIDRVESAMTQMAKVIIRLLETSFGNQNYAKVIQCLTALRQIAIQEDAAIIYNNHIREVKVWCDPSTVKSSPRYELWEKLKSKNLGLITRDESKDIDNLNVSKEVAMKFWNENENDSSNLSEQEDLISNDNTVQFNADDLEDML